MVTIIEPVAGQVFDGDTLTFSWVGSDADGDDLSYVVEYSADGGASYETMASGYKSNSIVKDRVFLPGSVTARIRVTVSDGTRSTTTESSLFEVKLKPPKVTIHSPVDGSDGHGAWILDATAYDPEDGSISRSDIGWSSDIDGDLGSNQSEVQLSPGTHQLTATVTNKRGKTGSATITITVLERPEPEDKDSDR